MVLLDTAGRTTLDEAMMSEAAEVKKAANPHEVLLVADALTGQDAVNLARAFDERVGLTGIVLTRVDGDGRGGAALSMRAVTGKPIKLIGTGEKLDALEEFDPARIAGRILGMGDIVALVEKAATTIDAEKAMRAAEKMRKGQFDLADLREQLTQMQSMGGIGGLMGMLPGVAKMKNQIANAGLDENVLKRQVAIIDSMTPQGAAQSRPPQAQPQEAHRLRLRHHAGGDQQAFEDAPRHGRHDEGHGLGQARRARRLGPDARLRRRRAADAGTDGGTRQENAGRQSWRLAAEHAGQCAGLAEPAAAISPACRVESFQDCRAFPVSERRNDRLSHHSSFRGAAKRRAGMTVFSQKGKTANVSRHPHGPRRNQEAAGLSHRRRRQSRRPRDGRFIERLGHFNPLLPKDKTERLKLDLDKVQAWMKKGAQPSDRVTRFLDAAGIVKREKRNNPEKAVPRKERKAKEEEATKAKEASDAAAKTARGDGEGRHGQGRCRQGQSRRKAAEAPAAS